MTYFAATEKDDANPGVENTFVRCFADDREAKLCFGPVGRVRKFLTFGSNLYILFDSGRLYVLAWGNKLKKHEQIFDYSDARSKKEVEIQSQEVEGLTLHRITLVNTFKMYEKLGYNKARIHDIKIQESDTIFKFKVCLF